MSTTTATTALAPSQGPLTIIVAAAFLGLNAFFIGLRCYTSARIAKNFNFNDVFMIIALVRTHYTIISTHSLTSQLIYAGLFAILVFSVQAGVGGHTLAAGIKGIGDSLKVPHPLHLLSTH